MNIVKTFLAFLIWGALGFTNFAFAEVTCKGKFMNPITDLCWSCVFPLSIGSTQVLTNNQEDYDSGVGSNPFCGCSSPPKLGISTSFWEPVKLIEVVRKPYCFVSLGGVTIDPGISAPSHVQKKNIDGDGQSFYQVHWYTAPMMFWLELLLDNTCLEKGTFDLGYLTEVDPLWSDSESTFILNPDAALFANPIAKGACAADCVAATAGMPSNMLYWCAGCQGSMYPLDGFVSNHIGGVQASTLLTQRIITKMHREGAFWGASGKNGQCGYYPIPLMDKRTYKSQMVYPTPNTKKINGKCCQPLGRTTTLWGAGKEYPYQGEDYSYMIFRKRDCCAGGVGP